MNFSLQRKEYRSDGIFGQLLNEDGSIFCCTLEHGYANDNGDGTFVPKVATGTYTCILHPPNRLPYTTYMLENVPDFQGRPVSGILIHRGNYNSDSVGCILLGTSVTKPSIGDWMISSSGPIFNKFMALQNGINEFTLTIS